MPIPSLWAQSLQPASWREIPFVVEASGYAVGRRISVHEYPYRDTPFVEDLGKARQEVSFAGFLVGDDCFQQRDKLAAACEKAGSGPLVHPSVGHVTANLISASFNERADRGRTVEVQFTFIVTAHQLTPGLPPSQIKYTPAVSLLAAIEADEAAVVSFIARVQNAILLGPRIIMAIVGRVLGFANLLIRVVNNASNILGMFNGLQILAPPGYQLSRYSTGTLAAPNRLLNNVTGISIIARVDDGAQIMLDAAVENSGLIQSHILTAQAFASTDPLGDFPASVQTLVADVVNSITDPADQIEALAALTDFPDPLPASPDAIDTAIAVAAAGTATFCRRTALAALARVCASYQPCTAADVQALLNQIVPLFDAEILYAADQGDTISYQMLVSLRAAVVADLQARGLNLPELITITEPSNLPSLVLANAIYGDARREAELVERVEPIHPLFFPVSFQALSS